MACRAPTSRHRCPARRISDKEKLTVVYEHCMSLYQNAGVQYSTYASPAPARTDQDSDRRDSVICTYHLPQQHVGRGIGTGHRRIASFVSPSPARNKETPRHPSRIWSLHNGPTSAFAQSGFLIEEGCRATVKPVGSLPRHGQLVFPALSKLQHRQKRPP